MSGRTALVVDDSKSARFALRKYLENHSYKVDTAESAEAAYHLLRELTPDLIFLDHIMPGEDGFEALRHIKSDPRTAAIPVVICSGNEGEAFVADARAKGAAGVLAKPPTPEQLLQVVDNVMREREAAVQRAAEEEAARLATEAQVQEPADADAAPATESEATPGAEAGADPAPAIADDSDLHAQLAALRHALEELQRRPAGSTPAPADLEARLARLEEQVLPRLERLEQDFAALRQQVQESQELAAREAADRIAGALLKALGRDA